MIYHRAPINSFDDRVFTISLELHEYHTISTYMISSLKFIICIFLIILNYMNAIKKGHCLNVLSQKTT